MSKWINSTALRLVLTFVMTLGMLLSQAGNAASHNPAILAAAEAARHAELKAEFADHGHVHDDGFEEEQTPGHAHGHNPADHSHETPNTLAVVKAPIPPIDRFWHPYPPVVVDLEMVFRLERPPRSFVAP